MKKNKKINLFKIVFMTFLFSFMVIYFGQLSGYYEYQNHKKMVLTEEQIKKFEQDIDDGKKIDIDNYVLMDVKYDNKLSKVTSKLSDGISSVVKSGVEKTFKFLTNLMEE